MTGAVILRPSEMKTNDRGGGARTTPLVNGITAFDPGAAIGLHSHNCEESVMVIEGRVIAEIDGVEHHLDNNDTTWFPPMSRIVSSMLQMSPCGFSGPMPLSTRRAP